MISGMIWRTVIYQIYSENYTPGVQLEIWLSTFSEELPQKTKTQIFTRTSYVKYNSLNKLATLQILVSKRSAAAARLMDKLLRAQGKTTDQPPFLYKTHIFPICG